MKNAEHLNVQALVRKHALSVPIVYTNDNGDELAMRASVYLFDCDGLWAFVEGIVHNAITTQVDSQLEYWGLKNGIE